MQQSLQAGLINNEHRPPHPKALNLTREFFQLEPEDVSEFHSRLQSLVREFQERGNPPDAPWYAFLNVLYPTQYPLIDDENNG